MTDEAAQFSQGSDEKCTSLFLTFLLACSQTSWCSGNTFDAINEVTVRQAWLVLRWVTACGRVNHLGM